MRYLVFCSALILSGSLSADEPSVAYECKGGLRTVISETDSKDRIDLCPEEEGFKIDADSFGANHHMCWLHGSTKEVEGLFKISDTDCTLSFKVSGEILSADFEGKCRYVCGAREWFKSANYKQKYL